MHVEDQKFVRALLKEVLRRGYSVDVYDGETISLRNSFSEDRIFQHLDTTDADILYFYSDAGYCQGCVHLVYGNDPGEIIADYSCNAFVEEVLAIAEGK